MTTPAPTRCADCGKDKPHAGLGLCRACYQRAWKKGTLPAKVRREGERRDCQCKKAQHQHGTRLAYVVDRCRCRACLDANNDYERAARQRKILARWNPGMPDTMTDLVDAQPARDHLRSLTAAGMGLKTISAKYNLGHGSISTILYGKYPNNPDHPEHRPPRRRITRDLERRILAARLDHADQASIDGTGTRRRLQALVATGWSQKRLAHLIGWNLSNFNGLVHGYRPHVHAATAKAVADLYDQLWNTPPTAANRFEAAGITRARNVAQQHGWSLPMAWDDDHGPHGIDNPDATPSTGSEIRALGSTVEDIEYLADADETPDAIAARLGTRWDRLATTLRRNGRHDLLDRLNRRRAAA